MRNSSVSRLCLAASLVATFLLAATAPAFAGTLDRSKPATIQASGCISAEIPLRPSRRVSLA